MVQTVDWKTYVDDILREKDRAINAALASAKEAVQVAETNAEKWRANANEWRAAMSDRDKAYMLKSEFEMYKEATNKTIDELLTFKRLHEGIRKSVSDGWGWLAGAIGLLLAIASYFGK